MLEESGADVPFNSVDRLLGVHIARLDFLDALGPAANYLQVGSVSDASGAIFHDRRTIGTAREVTIRGGKESTRDFCADCGAFLYLPVPKRYLLKRDVAGIPVAHCEDGLLVDRDVYDRLRSRRMKIRITKLDELAAPRDGLPLDLAEVTPESIEPHRSSEPKTMLIVLRPRLGLALLRREPGDEIRVGRRTYNVIDDHSLLGEHIWLRDKNRNILGIRLMPWRREFKWQALAELPYVRAGESFLDVYFMNHSGRVVIGESDIGTIGYEAAGRNYAVTVGIDSDLKRKDLERIKTFPNVDWVTPESRSGIGLL